MSRGRAVLILAPNEDRLADAALAELARRAVSVLRVDPADLPGGWDLGWSVVSRSGFAGPPARRQDFQDLHSVLIRPGSWSARGATAQEDRDYFEAEIAATMLGLIAGLDCRVVNRPAPGRVGRLVLREAAEVATSGLEPTPTLMTSDLEAARAFYRDECDGRALIAPASGCAPPEMIEGEGGERSLAARGSDPIVLQTLPAGTIESVWVVGERGLCAHPIDHSVRGACVRAAHGLGLGLARFDLVVCPEQAACVEISQVPDLPDDQGACTELVDALCDLLASGSVTS